MESKLDQLRRVLEANPQQYPTAYHLAIMDGEYDVTVIQTAMVNDLFNTVPKPVELLDPLRPQPILLSLADIQREQELLDHQSQAAKDLALELATRHDIQAANRAVQFIQAMGRNSHAAKELVRHLQPPYEY